jgi:hypothetical protein
VKAFAAPTNPATSFQTTNRNRLATAIAAWQALSDAERNQWCVFADGQKDDFSNLNNGRRSGFNLFVSRKKLLLSVNESSNPSPHVNRIAGRFDVSVVFLSTSQLTIRREVLEGSTLWRGIIEASPAVSSAKMSINSVPTYGITTTILGSSGNITLTSDWTNHFGALTGLSGSKIFFRLRPVYTFDTSTGSFLFAGIESKPTPWTAGIIT